MSIATISAASSRLQAIRAGLSPKEWTRLGGMVAFIIALYVAGFSLLTAAAPGH
jgi:high-affinity nickel-transport protein